MKSKSLNKKSEEVIISKNELKQLVFWASYGVCKSLGGSYSETIIDTILQFGELSGCLSDVKDTDFGKYLEKPKVSDHAIK